MAGKVPGPECRTRHDWFDIRFDIDDGTLVRQPSPCAGVLSAERKGAITVDPTPPITAEEIWLIVPRIGQKAAATASDINQVVKDAGITTRLGQAMLIAQLAVETGYFKEGPNEEKTTTVVYNKETKKYLGPSKGLKRGEHKKNLQAWRASKKKFEAAEAKKAAAKKAAELKANALAPKAAEAAPKIQAPPPAAATDYTPGDMEYDYLLYLYDKTSPNKHYQDRAELPKHGNTTEGDGKRYCGKGYIHLTWKKNYEDAGTALGLKLVGKPELAMVPANAVRIAGWFWKTRGCNAYTYLDTTKSFENVTIKINGGLNHQSDRVIVFRRAKRALGLERTWGDFPISARTTRTT